jgi:putative membrane protein
MGVLVHIVVLTATVLLLARFLPDIHVRRPASAVAVAVVFSLLNWGLGWLIRAALFVPAVLTLGLLFLFIPFIVNTVVLWLTDKVLHAFEIRSLRALLLGGAIITVVNWLTQIGPRL